MAPDGSVQAEYEKQKPIAVESVLGIVPGVTGGSFRFGGHNALALICADFCYSKCYTGLPTDPDLVVVPTFSLSQRSSPRAAKAWWFHMAVSRAYAHGTHVAISDWSVASTYHGERASGVASFVEPRPPSSTPVLTRLGNRQIGAFSMSLSRLEALRPDRNQRSFLTGTRDNDFTRSSASDYVTPRFCSRCGSGLKAGTIHGEQASVCADCGQRHFRRPTAGVAVVVVEQGRVLLVKRAYGEKAGQWCIPCGHVGWDEDLRAAGSTRNARRDRAPRRIGGRVGRT